MNYVAKHYVTVAGTLYSPGEVINQPMKAETVQRFLAAKAIEPLGDRYAVVAHHTASESADDAEDGIDDAETDETGMDDGGIEDADSVAAPAPKKKGKVKK